MLASPVWPRLRDAFAISALVGLCNRSPDETHKAYPKTTQESPGALDAKCLSFAPLDEAGLCSIDQ
jgi:hypothetical protein